MATKTITKKFRPVAAKAIERRSPTPRQAPRAAATGNEPAQWALAEAPGDDENDTQFVAAVSRAISVLAAFRPDDGPLGNAELAERTALPKPTVSRLTYTLARRGCLTYNPRYRVYELGPMVVALGHLAMKTIDVRQLARPLMQRLAHQANFNVGLGTRDHHSMVYVDAFEGNGLVGLRLFVGSRLPILSSSMGRAFLAGLPEEERELVLAQLRPGLKADWPKALKIVKQAVAEFEAHGFCSSIGDWRADIHGVAAPIRPPDGGQVYAVNLGGPAYLLPAARLRDDLGPQIAALAQKVEAALSPEVT